MVQSGSPVVKRGLYNKANEFITRPTCQFASESGALRWRQKQLRLARFKQFSLKPVLRCEKRDGISVCLSVCLLVCLSPMHSCRPSADWCAQRCRNTQTASVTSVSSPLSLCEWRGLTRGTHKRATLVDIIFVRLLLARS